MNDWLHPAAYAEHSIAHGLQRVVLEQDDESLSTRVREQVEDSSAPADGPSVPMTTMTEAGSRRA